MYPKDQNGTVVERKDLVPLWEHFANFTSNLSSVHMGKGRAKSSTRVALQTWNLKMSKSLKK